MLCRRQYYAVGHHKAGLRPLCTDLYGPPVPQTAYHSNIVPIYSAMQLDFTSFHLASSLPTYSAMQLDFALLHLASSLPTYSAMQLDFTSFHLADLDSPNT